MLWAFEEREELLATIEALAGTRFHMSAMTTAGCRYDMGAPLLQRIVRACHAILTATWELHIICSTSPL